MARKSGIELRASDRMRFNKKMRRLERFIKPSRGFDIELKKYVSRISEISTDFVPVITGKLKQSLFFREQSI